MKKSSKQTLAKRGVWVGRAQNAAGTQVHADKRRLTRPAEKQRLKRELQQETARQRGPFRCLWSGSFSHGRQYKSDGLRRSTALFPRRTDTAPGLMTH